MSRNEQIALPVAQFYDVCYAYQRARSAPVAALKNLSFTIEAGQFLALLGPSGCGKSTALRLLAGLLTPTTGQVLVSSHDPTVAKANHQVSVVFQQPALLNWRTVWDNIHLPFELGLPKQTPTNRVTELIKLVGLEGFESSYPAELSGGMQQRVALARALVGQPSPSLILMDEPFASVDQITRERLNQELEALWLTYKPAVFFITHSITEACVLADRVIVMSSRPGSVIASIDIPFGRPRSEEVIRSMAFIELSSKIRELLNHA